MEISTLAAWKRKRVQKIFFLSSAHLAQTFFRNLAFRKKLQIFTLLICSLNCTVHTPELISKTPANKKTNPVANPIFVDQFVQTFLGLKLFFLFVAKLLSFWIFAFCVTQFLLSHNLQHTSAHFVNSNEAFARFFFSFDLFSSFQTFVNLNIFFFPPYFSHIYWFLQVG